jgi:hypothetical protein
LSLSGRPRPDDPEVFLLLLLDDGQNLADLGHTAFGDARFDHAAGHRRGELDSGFGGLDLAQRLEGGHLVAGLDVPGQHLDLVDALANVRQPELEGQGQSSSARRTAATMRDTFGRYRSSSIWAG